MEKIYKSCSSKYTNEQIKNLTGTTSFASFERLLTTSLYDAIRKRPNEVMVGMIIDFDGIQVYLETTKL